jgi:glycolate oxidase iron-sulfur subunit
VTELFHQNEVRRIITVDPHTYDLLKVQYKKYVPGFDFEVYYYTDFLDKLDFDKDRVLTTLHEPCHFTLREGSYNGPIKYARKVADVILPDRSGKKLMCCGGPDELLFGSLSDEISSERFQQLKSTDARNILTVCPICYSNLRKDSSVQDLATYLKAHLKT